MKSQLENCTGLRFISPRSVVVGMFLSLLSPLQGVDVRLKPVADGSQSYRGDETNDGSDWGLSAEYAESNSIYSSARRILMKFDTRSLTATQMRNAKLYMFGGCGADTAVLTKVYKYSNDNWNDNSVPYPRNSSLQYLAEKMVSNAKTADYIGSSEWHVYDIGSALGGWETDGYLSIALRNHTPNPDRAISSVSFISRNSVTWNGSKGKEPYLAFETWSDSGVSNSDFTSSTSAMEAWTAQGGGTAALIPDPNDPSNQMVELTTGSPVSISQVVDTPEDPFYVRIGYEFRTLDGQLDVSLVNRDGTETTIGSLSAPNALEADLKTVWYRVESPALLAADHVTLKLSFDGVSGSKMWIDEATFSTEGEPSTSGDFRITSISVVAGGSQLELTWTSEPSATYTIQESADIIAAPWSEVSPGISSQGTSTTHSVPITSSPRRFFRVVEEP